VTDTIKEPCDAFPETWVHGIGSEGTFDFFCSLPGLLRKSHISSRFVSIRAPFLKTSFF